uniref:DUF4817 domain-containing protein n=1 Tax=Strigamia maritima TaxID=126957 RepID=T1IYJ9_STRMM
MAPHTFTNEIFVELLLLYFRNDKNQSKASQLYAELHPDQPAPSHKVVERLIKRFLATGSVQEIKHGRPKTATAENNTIHVLASVEVEPKLSVRQRAQASGISKNSVCRILKTNKIHPYKTRVTWLTWFQNAFKTYEPAGATTVKTVSRCGVPDYTDEGQRHSGQVARVSLVIRLGHLVIWPGQPKPCDEYSQKSTVSRIDLPSIPLESPQFDIIR